MTELVGMMEPELGGIVEPELGGIVELELCTPCFSRILTRLEPVGVCCPTPLVVGRVEWSLL